MKALDAYLRCNHYNVSRCCTTIY